MMAALQDNSTHEKILTSIKKLCLCAAAEMECEAVDVLVINEQTKTLAAMTGGVNSHCNLIDCLKDSVRPTADMSVIYSDLELPLSMPLVKKAIEGSAASFSMHESEVKEMLDAAIVDKIEGAVGTGKDWKLRSVMAVPIRCTRKSSHLVAMFLCVNKLVGDIDIAEAGESERSEGEEEYRNFTAEDTVLPSQLSQFAGIALSSLEMLWESNAKKNQLKRVLETFESLADDKNIGEQLQRLFESATTLVDCDDLSLYLSVQDGKNLKLVHTSVADKQDLVDDHGMLPIDLTTIPGVAASTKAGVYASRDAKSPFENLLSAGEHSVLCAPVLYLDKVEAVIVAVNQSNASYFSMDDHEILMMLGTSTGVLLHHSHIMKNAIWASRLADATGRLINNLSNPFVTLEQVLKEVRADATFLVPCQSADLYMVDHNAQELWTFFGGGGDVERVDLNIDTLKRAQVARSGMAWYGEENEKTETLISIPVFGHSYTTAEVAVVAVLQLHNKQDLYQNIIKFDDEDLSVLTNFAQKVGKILQLKMADFSNKKLSADKDKNDSARALFSISKQYAKDDVATDLR